MAKATDTNGILRQNLVDCGCDNEMIEKCMCLAENGCSEKIAVLLKQKRGDRLNSLHKEQEKLDCLDFLIYRIGKGDFKQNE